MLHGWSNEYLMMETDLYDKNGYAVAYIAEDAEHSIYTWDGHAVCYLVGDMVYGWNGHHLGWFIDGVIYDVHGYRVGFIKSKCPVLPKMPTLKSLKFLKRIKYLRNLPYIKPWLKFGTSDMILANFILQGAI